MKSLVTLILIHFLFFSAFADEDGTKAEPNVKENSRVYITGTVKDKNTGEYLVGVEVEIEGTNLKTYTDFDGNFSFENVIPGIYDISVNYISYEREELESMEISSRTSMLELELHQLQ